MTTVTTVWKENLCYVTLNSIMRRQNQTVSIPGYEGMWTFKEVQKQNLYVHIISSVCAFQHIIHVFIYDLFITVRVGSGADVWDTAPQNRRLQVQFPVGSLEIGLGSTQPLAEMSAKEFPWA